MATKSRKTKTKTKAKLDPKKHGHIASLAQAMVTAPAGAEPPVLGARTRIWKQDPSVAIASRDVYIHTTTHAGPADSQIKIEGLPTVHPDVNGDFLFEPSSENAFDAVHTYTVVRQVLTMFQRALNEKMKWQWNTGSNTDPIAVFPNAGETANAFYSRRDKALKFFFFRPAGAGPSDPFVFTCRSLDIVAHEAGHAVLDSLRPGWILSGQSPQTGGLHESFGDITAILLVLSQLDQVEYVIAQTKADLHQKNILSAVAEEFGFAIGRPTGLRNADNDLTLDDVTNEVHDISKVFTGAFYDILADAFTAARNPRDVDDAVVLHDIGQKMARLILKAIRAAPASNATFADVANEMLKLAQANPAEYPDFDTFITNQFSLRKVLGPGAVAGPTATAGFAPSVAGCCGTMQNTASGD